MGVETTVMASPVLHSSSDQGFTLVELLVAILIISILIAIAVPALLGTQDRANDVPAKEMADAAATTAETVALDNGGSYSAVGKATLHSYEPTIATANVNTKSYLSAASGTATSYTLTVTSVATGNRFMIARAANGTFTRLCTLPTRIAPRGGCENVKGTKGSW